MRFSVWEFIARKIQPYLAPTTVISGVNISHAETGIQIDPDGHVNLRLKPGGSIHAA